MGAPCASLRCRGACLPWHSAQPGPRGMPLGPRRSGECGQPPCLPATLRTIDIGTSRACIRRTPVPFPMLSPSHIFVHTLSYLSLSLPLSLPLNMLLANVLLKHSFQPCPSSSLSLTPFHLPSLSLTRFHPALSLPHLLPPALSSTHLLPPALSSTHLAPPGPSRPLPAGAAARGRTRQRPAAPLAGGTRSPETRPGSLQGKQGQGRGRI